MREKLNERPLPPASRTHGGAKVPHFKNTADFKTVIMPPPERVYIAMQQHIGAPCEPLVKKGDHVDVGQIIGDSDKYVSAPIHSSVSGTVEAFTEIILPSGAKVNTVVIASDGQMTPYAELTPHPVTSRDELVKASRDCGLVGLGGAGFPTHVKLKSSPDKPIDTLIINAAECEPYITVDYRECMEEPEHLLDSIQILLDFMAVHRIIIAIEDNKPEAIKLLTKIAAENDEEDRIKVMKLHSRYPQGAEKILVQATTGRKIPMGALPSDVGCAVMNITSVATLGRYIKTGMPLVSKRITVDGSGINEPKNVIVPIGTMISDVVEFCGGYKGEPAKILMGGPMMGFALCNDTLPILKQNNAVLIFDEKDARVNVEESACIRCGRCAAACPMSLMPTLIERYAKIKDTARLSKIGVGICMECGSCAYSCPANRPLVQYMRLAKQLEREARNK